MQNLEFRIGTANDCLFDSFGQLNDITEDFSSDVYRCKEEEEEFHETSDFKKLLKFFSFPIDNIVPLQNSKVLLLSNGTVFNTDFQKEELYHESILWNVHQIALVQPCGDVLSLSKSRKDIQRIYRGSLVTRFINTKNDFERYECVGSAGDQAYACIVHSIKRGKYWITELSLVDEFGRILISFTLDQNQRFCVF